MDLAGSFQKCSSEIYGEIKKLNGEAQLQKGMWSNRTE